jgi:hypothetical protein
MADQDLPNGGKDDRRRRPLDRVACTDEADDAEQYGGEERLSLM